jgi:hypothetical protein
MRDIYNEPLDEAVALFGARQVLRSAGEKAPATKVRFMATAWTEAGELTAEGLTACLTPTTGRAAATHENGDCAAVVNEVGKGRTLLLGLEPGLSFQKSGGARGAGGAWFRSLLGKVLKRPRAELSYPLSEVTLFEHESGLAVLLTDFGFGAQPKDGTVLSVEPRRKITSVTSALKGALPFEEREGRLEIKVPHLDPVDVILLR